MSKKHFSLLLLVTVVVAVAVLLMPGQSSHQPEFERGPLLTGLADKVNDTDRVTISSAGNTEVATLQREDGGWVVSQAGGYAADWGKLKALLAALAQAEVIEQKTANPEYFPRLGLADISQPDSTAVQVSLAGGGNEVAVLVGQEAKGLEGQYVRLAGVDQALLIDRTLEVPGEMRDWLQRDIIDLAEDEVVEVTIEHADGEQVRALKTSADDTDFQLQNIPEGREIQSAWSVNSLAGGLSTLQLDQVRPAAEIDWTGASRVKAVTADGLLVTAEWNREDDTTWVRFAAASYTPGDAVAGDAASGAGGEAAQAADGTAETGQAAAATGSEQDASEALDDSEAESGAAAQLADRIAAINARVDGWAYVLPDYKLTLLTKRMDDLLKAEAES